MLLRFSLYGFLKNQRYFEPFLILALLEKGFDFFLIGLLIATREATTNVLEIPSGAVADACGRRGSMILSFFAYIVSFVLLGSAGHPAWIFVAMAAFGVGDAFRTGTHKAMIFEWLRLAGRTDERTKVYGYTRSWSKIGSALSALLAAAFVLWRGDYTAIFYFATVPYALNIVNFLGYPKELDGRHAGVRAPREVARRLGAALKTALRKPALRRLIGESMGFEGVFHAAKDYLQPVLQALVLASWTMPLLGTGDGLDVTRRTALLVGPVYFVLFLLSAFASRQSHRFAGVGEERAAGRAWGGAVVLYAALALAAWNEARIVAVVVFVALYVLQNLWRPILISRFDSHSDEAQGATVLSIESQAQRVATMVAAPLLGAAVDAVRAHAWGGDLWPVGGLGLVVALPFFLTARRFTTPSASTPSAATR